MSLGILCPGQGSQHPHMLDLLMDKEPAMQILQSAQELLGLDIGGLIESDSESHRNRHAQPLLCAAEMATWFALRPHVPAPKLFAGYSVGELAAYGCAGAIPAIELLALASRRAQHMDSSGNLPTQLLAISGLARTRIAEFCFDYDAEIAIVNGPDQWVVGVEQSRAGDLRQAAIALGAAVTPLAVEVASHTPWLATASAAFQKDLQSSSLGNPPTPVLAGISGLPVFSRRDAIATLSRQICTTIDWAACMQSLVEYGCTVLLELGPGRTLTKMAQAALPNLSVRSVEEFNSLAGAAAWVNKCVGRL